MIDIENAKKEFMKYTDKYNENEVMIERKVKHSLRVMENAKRIAKTLELSEEDINLATLIGVLHDIGRFEQQKRANTYSDTKSGIDHGDLGAEILIKEREIEKYVVDTKYYPIIEKAVRNHNKYKIEEGLTDREKLFCFIARDADKIDILEELIGNDVENMAKSSGYEINDNITPKFIEMLMQNKQLERKEQNYVLDWYLNSLTFLFDINYRESFYMIKEKI